jgi:hypothetical protein
MASGFGWPPYHPEPIGIHETDMLGGKGKEVARDFEYIFPADYDPFIQDAMLVPGSPYPYNPYFEDGYISDEEGHPDLTRISPCTFARWAVGCAPDSWTKKKPVTTTPKRPVIPNRSSSLGCLEPQRYSVRHPPLSCRPSQYRDPNTSLQTPLIDTPHRPDAPVVPAFDAVQAVKEIGALKRTLSKLVTEKEKLCEEIGALRQERADLQAKMEGM